MRLFWISAVLLLLASCKGMGSSGRAVAVTDSSQAWLVKELLGDDSGVDVLQLLPAGANAENFEPSIQTMATLGEAQAWFAMSTPGFESELRAKIQNNFPDLQIMDVSEGIKRDVGHFHNHDDAHAHHDEEAEESDPHLLTSLRNARRMATNMAEALSKLYPDIADSISRRRINLDYRLRVLDDSISKVLSTTDALSGFLIEHPSLGYFARDYGLRQIAIEQSHKEATPAQRAESYTEAIRHDIEVIIIPKEHPSNAAEELGRQQNLRVVRVALDDTDYLNIFRTLARELNKKQTEE